MTPRCRIAIAMAIVAAFALTTRARAAGKIVIAEAYGGGGSGNSAPFSTFINDFVVLLNTGDAPVDITGWSLQYQGATSTGSPSASNRTNFSSGIINPGQYFLVLEVASGSAVGTPPIPIPADVTGAIGLSNGAGKVFLVNNQTAITTAGSATAATITGNAAAVVDQLSYGTANLAEGGAAAPGASRFTGIFRKLGGYQDTDNNAADFVVGPASPFNSTMYSSWALGTSPVHSSPTVFNGNLFYGDDDGKVYGVKMATGQTLPGFPFDTRANGALPIASVLGRIAVRYVGGDYKLFFVASDTTAFCITMGGTYVWSTNRFIAGSITNNMTPAVMTTDDPDQGIGDYVFVGIGTGVPNSASIVKLRAETGATVRRSLPLGDDMRSTPSVSAGSIYVGVMGGAGGVLRLDPVSLTVQTQIAAGTGSIASPFVAGITGTPFAFPVAYVATMNGTVYAENAVNGQPIPNFPVTVEAGATLSSPFPWGGSLYVGSSTNKLYRVAADTGASTLLYDAGTVPTGGGTGVSGISLPGSITGGVAIDPPRGSGPGAVMFGSTNGFVYQVPLDVGSVPGTVRATCTGSQLNTAPAVDTTASTTTPGAIGCDDGRLYRFSRF